MIDACSLSILVARTDVRFMRWTIPHLVRTCRFPFRRRVLVVDTAPLGPAYQDRPGVGSMAELREACDALIADGVVDEAVDIDYSEQTRERLYQKHFSRPVKHTHNFRGYPILGSMFAIESAAADSVVHFDSDMLLYQAPGFDWIREGLALMKRFPEIASVLPLSGPPTTDGRLTQAIEDGETYVHDPRGFYKFNTFTSRVFLINRRRFDSLLPLDPPGAQAELLTGESRLPPWEDMVGARLLATSHLRVDLDSHDAFTLHPQDHGPAFVAALPSLIPRIERGDVPPGQGGYYDLRPELWC